MLIKIGGGEYHTNTIKKIIERGKIDTPNTHIPDLHIKVK